MSNYLYKRTVRWPIQRKTENEDRGLIRSTLLACLGRHLLPIALARDYVAVTIKLFCYVRQRTERVRRCNDNVCVGLNCIASQIIPKSWQAGDQAGVVRWHGSRELTQLGLGSKISEDNYHALYHCSCTYYSVASWFGHVLHAWRIYSYPFDYRHCGCFATSHQRATPFVTFGQRETYVRYLSKRTGIRIDGSYPDA